MITITLPWPSRILSPNSRGLHWGARAKAKKAARSDGRLLALAAMGRAARPQGPQKVAMTFHPPNARARDTDNMLAACKAALDGIADAIGVDDSQWQISLTRGEPHRPLGQVIVTVAAL